MLKTKFTILETEADKIRSICEDVERKDPTFKFKLERYEDVKTEFGLEIFSMDMRSAHTRGKWIKKIVYEHFKRKVSYDVERA